MSLNLDIWYEVIKYFQYPRDKTTLSALTLTSRCLSNLALDVIWRNGKCILEIVSVINSFAPSPEKPLLEYIREPRSDSGDSDDEDPVTPRSSSGDSSEEGSWVLNEPLPHPARMCALGYLARIRKLLLWQSGPPDMKEPIWPILSASLSPHGPLLPNLRHLEVHFRVYDCNEYLIPLLSPSLKILKLSDGERPPKPKATLTFLNLAKAHGCDLEHFTHRGCSIKHLPGIIGTHFKNLQNVVFPFSNTPLQQPNLTLARFLTSLPSLRSLTCHLAIFLPPTIDEKSFCHTGLQNISITCAQGALRELFDHFVFPSVTEVQIGDGQVLCLEGLESSCPHTRQIKLYFFSAMGMHSNGNILEFKHIASLISLQIQVFSLGVYQHEITPFHLHTLTKSWPTLRYFRLFSSDIDIDPLPTLTAFRNHPCLEHVIVRLPFNRFVDDILKIQDSVGTHAMTQGSTTRTRLRSLCFDCNGRDRPTVTRATKRVLVEYLSLLFPSLEKLEFSCRDIIFFCHRAEVAEFQEVMLELRKERMDPVDSV